MKRILDIKNFKLSFYGSNGVVPAVRNVNLYVDRGETVALVGESGCGKTALCRAILGLHSSHARVEGGSIDLCGYDVVEMTDRQMEAVRGKKAAMVFQDPMTSLNPTFSIGRQIRDAVLLHENISKAEAKKRAVELLGMVGIAQPEERYMQYPHQFSGGMRQRAAIAIALACSPELIIADEPTTALDVQIQDEIMGLLKDLCREQGKAMLFVTHDLGLAENLADRTAVMKDGVILEEGPTERLFKTPQAEYTKKLLGYVAYGKGTSHYHGKAGVAGEKTKEKAEEEAEGEALKFRTNLKDYAVIADKLCKVFPAGRKKVKTVLNDFDMTIERGEIVGLIGPSGCGKSTLARCIMGIYRPDGGEIRIADGLKMQMIFQDSASAFNPRMKLREIIAEPLVIASRKEKRSLGAGLLRMAVEEAASKAGLGSELLDRHPYDVSGGQRQRAAIARALITEPDFIIADEPISSLDIPVQSQIVHLLKKLHDENNLTMLIISHDLPMVEHISDRIVHITSEKK